MRTRDKILGGLMIYSLGINPIVDTATKKYVWNLTKEEAAVATGWLGMPWPSNVQYDAAHKMFYGEGIYDTLKPMNDANNKKAAELVKKAAESVKPFLLLGD